VIDEIGSDAKMDSETRTSKGLTFLREKKIKDFFQMTSSEYTL
jgi:hypothetical protein